MSTPVFYVERLPESSYVPVEINTLEPGTNVNDVLLWDGFEWLSSTVPAPTNVPLNTLESGTNTNDVLLWNGATWTSSVVPAPTNVPLNTLESGTNTNDVLLWNGATWTSSVVPAPTNVPLNTLESGTNTNDVLLWNGATWTSSVIPKTTLLFVNPNMTFGGATSTPTTSGHIVSVQLSASGNAILIKINMMREGGIHFNLLGSNATGNQVICTIPVAYRPIANTYCIGWSSSNNFWANNTLSWGGFIINTDGKVYQRSGNSTTVITSVQPNLEQITGELIYTLNNSTYTGDGIS